MKNYKYARCCANCIHRKDKTSPQYDCYDYLCDKNDLCLIFADMVCDDFDNEEEELDEMTKLNMESGAFIEDED